MKKEIILQIHITEKFKLFSNELHFCGLEHIITNLLSLIF